MRGRGWRMPFQAAWSGWFVHLGWLAVVVCALGVPGSPTWAAASPAAAGEPPVPVWTAPVMDQTGTLGTAQIQALTEQIRGLARTKGSQLFVLMVPSTGSDTIEQYARRVFDQWRIGRKDVDDGVLLLVAKQDRHVRIEVGYGLEGAVTDALAGRIIREQMAPRFADGDFSGGLTAGVQSLVALISGEALPPPRAALDGGGEDAPLLMLAPIALVSLIVPAPMAAFMLGAFVWVATGSVGWVALAAAAGFFLAWLGHAMGWARRFQRSGRSGRDGYRGGGGDGSDGGTGGGGGGSGGGPGGGGGSGGGGGASGSW